MAVDDDVTIYPIDMSAISGSVSGGQPPLDDDRPAAGAGATDRSGPPRGSHE